MTNKKIDAVDFGNPFSGLSKDKPISQSDLIRAMRFVIAAEYEAVQLYTQLAESTANTLAQAVLQDVAKEELVHAGEFLKVLKDISPEEAKLYEEGEEEVADKARGNMPKATASLIKHALEQSAVPGGPGKFDYSKLTPGEVTETLTESEQDAVSKIKNKIDLTSLDTALLKDILRNDYISLQPTVYDIILADDELAEVKESEVSDITKKVVKLLQQDIKSILKDNETFDDTIEERVEKEPLQQFITRVLEPTDALSFDLTSGTNDYDVSFDVMYKDDVLALGTINRATNSFSLTLDTLDLTYEKVLKYHEVSQALESRGLKNVTASPLPLLSEKELSSPELTSTPWAKALPREEENRLSNIPLYILFGKMVKRLSKATGLAEDVIEAKLEPAFGKGSVDVSLHMVNNPKLFPEVVEPELTKQFVAYTNATISEADLSDFIQTLGG